MRQHHPFGKSGRAAGIEDARQVFAAPPGIGQRRMALDQGFITDEAGGGRGIADVNDPPQRGNLAAEGRCMFEKRVVDEEDVAPLSFSA
jgi:hypothetical protein